MGIRVGIPRALLYYRYYPAWKTFFNALQAEVVLSPETNKEILDAGVRLAVEEACLPVKIYLGHLACLRDRGADLIFVPRVVAVEEKKYFCPKILGLPEIARCSVPGLPELLTVEVNMRKKARKVISCLKKAAAVFDCRPGTAEKAIRAASKAQKRYGLAMSRGGLTPADYLNGVQSAANNHRRLKVGVLGHAYNIYDLFLSMNIIGKLKDLGAEVITTEMLSFDALREGQECFSKESFWTFGHELLGAAGYFHKKGIIEGLVLVASFGCGPDSLICELVERYYRRRQEIPVLLITLDEHTGEAGVVTRLEAFVDMLQWRRQAL